MPDGSEKTTETVAVKVEVRASGLTEDQAVALRAGRDEGTALATSLTEIHAIGRSLGNAARKKILRSLCREDLALG